jgi:hypothetical protein
MRFVMVLDERNLTLVLQRALQRLCGADRCRKTLSRPQVARNKQFQFATCAKAAPTCAVRKTPKNSP